MNLALSLSPQERVEMIEKGLSPLNESHIKQFLNGSVPKLTNEDRLNRIQRFMGDIPISRQLGSGMEKESDYNQIEGSFSSSTSFNKKSSDSIDENYDIGNYGTNSGGFNDFSFNLSNLKRKDNRSVIQENNNFNNIDVDKLGYDLGIKYLNSFIQNLKDSNSKNRITIYKNLKKLLEVEQKLKNSKKYSSFLNGVTRAEELMYKQLTS